MVFNLKQFVKDRIEQNSLTTRAVVNNAIIEYRKKDAEIGFKLPQVVTEETPIVKSASKLSEKTNLKKNLGEYNPLDIFNIQPLESNEQKGLREKVTNAYPFKEDIKSMLRNYVNITTVPKREKIGQREEEDIASGGQEGGRLIGNVLNIAPKMVNNLPFSDEFKNKLHKLMSTETGKSEVKIKVNESPIIAHELLHSFVRKQGNFPVEKFNTDWDNLKQGLEKLGLQNLLSEIDNKFLLGDKELYPNIENKKESLANERFAYLGGFLGQQGLKMFPPILKEYYKEVFHE